MFENAKCRTNNGITKITIATLKPFFLCLTIKHNTLHFMIFFCTKTKWWCNIVYMLSSSDTNSVTIFWDSKSISSIMLVFVDTFEIFQGYGHTFVFNYLCYHGNMYPPKHPSTCRGSPTFRARWEISSIGSIMPWQNWGAEAHSRIVFGVMACQI